MNEEPRPRGVWTRLFGEVRWTPPPWLPAAGGMVAGGARGAAAALRRHRKLLLGSAIGVLVLALGVRSAWLWYESRPKPIRYALYVQAPAITPIEEGAQPRLLRVSFNGSVARLDQVGKRVAQGITLSPQAPGEWRWEDDRTLVFAPSADWPIGQEFTLKLERSLFPEHILLEEYEGRFQTAPFTARLTNIELYQDPRNPKIKRVEATVSFSHPVDTPSFAKFVELRVLAVKKGLLSSGEQQFPFTVSFDKLKGQAYIHSDPVPIPPNDASMTLVVKPGRRPSTSRCSRA